VRICLGEDDASRPHQGSALRECISCEATSLNLCLGEEMQALVCSKALLAVVKEGFSRCVGHAMVYGGRLLSCNMRAAAVRQLKAVSLNLCLGREMQASTCSRGCKTHVKKLVRVKQTAVWCIQSHEHEHEHEYVPCTLQLVPGCTSRCVS
jgi:hypothetical protein